MIEGIEQALSDLKSIEETIDSLRQKNNNLRFDNTQLMEENEKLRGNLANALDTIERLNREQGESPHV